MKRIFLITAFLAIKSLSFAQLQVGASEMGTLNKAGKISEEDFARLKATTTVFVLQEADYANQAAFEQAIRRVWTITPFQIVKRSEVGKYASNRSYSVFSFDGFVIHRGRSGHTHISYNLWMGKRKKNGDLAQDQFARIIVYPDFPTIGESMRLSDRDEDQQRFDSYIYRKAVFSNWGPGFLMGYLAEVNKLLHAQELRGVFSRTKEITALQALKKDTLYVPDYVNVRFNMFTGAENMDEDKDEEAFTKAYPYPMKLVTAATLNKMILDSTRSIHYLVYTKSSTDKYVSIFSSAKPEMIYTTYSPMAYNFKSKDLKAVAAAIED